MSLNEQLAQSPPGLASASIALISEHASPLVPLGSIDRGDQNVYVANLAGQAPI